MFHQGVGHGAIAVHEVENAGWEAGLVQQPGDPLQGERCLFGRFEHVGVARRQCVREEPERHHAGEIEGGDHAEHTQGQAQHLAIDAVGRADQFVALLQDRHAASHLAILDRPFHLRPSVGQGFAVLLGDRSGQVVFISAKQFEQGKEGGDASRGRGAAPGGVGGGGGFNGAIGCVRGGEWYVTEDCARAGVFDWQGAGVVGFDPPAIDVIRKDSRAHSRTFSWSGRLRDSRFRG